MLLKLYSVEDNFNVVNKVLGDPFDVDIVVRNDFDVVSPVIVLYAIQNILDYNYCTIDDLKRSYFIDRFEVVNNSITKLFCKCDVLESYKADILNSVCRFKRKFKTGDYYAGNFDTGSRKNINVYESDKGFSGDSTMILTTVGG